MRRLFYVADNIGDAAQVTRALRDEGVSNWRLHVLAKDEAGLYTHNIHSANPIQQLDLIHTGARYALVGLAIGLIAALCMHLAMTLGWLDMPATPWTFVVLGVLGLGFGAWEGGLVGLTREHYQIERYHQEVEQGKYLIMVDVSRQQRPLVKELMNFEFPHIPYRGGVNPRVRILDKPKVAYHQTTH